MGHNRKVNIMPILMGILALGSLKLRPDSFIPKMILFCGFILLAVFTVYMLIYLFKQIGSFIKIGYAWWIPLLTTLLFPSIVLATVFIFSGNFLGRKGALTAFFASMLIMIPCNFLICSRGKRNLKEKKPMPSIAFLNGVRFENLTKKHSKRH